MPDVDYWYEEIAWQPSTMVVTEEELEESHVLGPNGKPLIYVKEPIGFRPKSKEK